MHISKNVKISFVALMGIFLLITLPSLAKIDPENIMGMWLFNEGKGGTAADTSGNGNDGEIHGAKWVDGKFGKALEFDGVGNWVEVPHSNTVGFKAGVSFTITLHFKGTKVAGALVGKNYEDTSQALPWYLLWNGGGDNKVALYLRDSASTSFRADGTTEIGDDQWHFIDEVILFNIALDEADMASIMNDGIESVTAVEPLNKLTTTWGRIKQQ